MAHCLGRFRGQNYVIAVGQEMEYRTEVTLDMVEEFLTPWLCGLLILLGAVIYFVGREFSSFRRLAKNWKRVVPMICRRFPTRICPTKSSL